MINIKLIAFCFVLTNLVFSVDASAGGGHDHGHGHNHDQEARHDEPIKGLHGGRLLKDGDFELELAIFEKGEPPRYRVYVNYNELAVDLSKLKVAIELTRFGNKKNYFSFIDKNDYLESKEIVEEPHSFSVVVTANYNNKEYRWSFESHEGRTELSEAALQVAKLGIEVAQPYEISNSIQVYGKLLPNENKVAHLVARYPGIVKEIRKELGDYVQKGEVLAVVESNQSLQPYQISTQIAGQIIRRHAVLGEYVAESREIFVVADLSDVWADFQVYRDDFGEIKEGQGIKVELGDDKEIPAIITYVSPLTDEATQSKLIRAVLNNASGKLKPGLFVSGTLSSTLQKVEIAVKREAIQTFRDWNVVYLTDGHTFQAMPVEMGRKDSKYVEILSGIEKGDRYVSTNSYVIKADIEKSGASHDH